ncbi:MAG: sulfur transferase domain-containing protein [Pirellulaceae bacterium]|nr:sulfur transferase domain-containing protein [Pirellulaceae bacterium]
MLNILAVRNITPIVSGFVLTVALVGCNVGVDTGQLKGQSNGQSASESSGQSLPTVTAATVGNTKPLLQVEHCYLAGQPQADDFVAFKAAGVKKVISIRDPSEVNWDERAAVEAAGMEFVQIPMRSPDQMTEDKIKEICELLQQADEQDEMVVLHCGAAVRASAVWLAHYCVSRKASWEEAEAVAATLVEVPDAWKAPVKSYVEKNVSRN